MKKVMKKTIVYLSMLALVCGLLMWNTPVLVWAKTVGAFEVTGGTEGTDYSYSSGVLNILTSTKLTIANTNPNAATTDRIEIENGVSANLVLSGVNIDVSSNLYEAALKIEDDSTGNVKITLAEGKENILKSGDRCAGLQKDGEKGTLEITGTGSLVAIGGHSAAGIGSGWHAAGSNITISGGIVTATGGVNGAGIGSGYDGAGSNITISGGTVTATGGSYGAGIGGGSMGAGNNITISGGSVTATGGESGAGIGGGDFAAGSNITISGGSVLATGIQYGSAIGGFVEYGAAIPVDSNGNNVYLLTLSNPNKEAVKIDGKDYPNTHSETDTNLYVYLTRANHTITIGTTEFEVKDLSDFTITGGTYGKDYYIEGDVVYVLSNTTLTVSNKTGIVSTTDRIEIADGASANLILSGVNIDVSSAENTAALKIADSSTGNVKITLAEGTKNTLKSGYRCAGLQKNGENGTLEITGIGSLEATGGESGAGIGGGFDNAGSNITISGGSVTATGGKYGAGIGGGYYGAGSNIIILGGSVKAVAGENASQIGGGRYSEAVTPTDGTNAVYLLEIDNTQEADIKINNKDYPDTHFDEKKIYAYLPGVGTHTVDVGSDSTKYKYSADKSKFLICPDSGDFTFTKPTALTYDGSSKDATVSYVNEVEGNGNITVYYYKADTDEKVASAVTAGTYKVKIDVAEGNTYAGVEGITDDTWTFTIEKADSVVASAPKAVSGLVYTGKAQALITAGETTCGTLKYSLDDATYKETIPTGINAGVYTVYYKVFGDANHKDSESQTVTVNVAKKSAFSVDALAKSYPNSKVTAEEINLAELLPSDCGEITCGASEVIGNVAVEVVPSGKQGVLSYSVMKGDADAEGRIEVVVTTQNYEDVVVVVNLSLYQSMTPVELFVERMYTIALNRDADEAGLANWAAQLEAGIYNGADIAAEFILGEEFALRALNDEEFVNVLYRTLFNREADAEGKDLWLGILVAGCSREYVLSNFVNLGEFTALCESYGIERGVMLENGQVVNQGIVKFVERLYEKVLGRSSDAEGLNIWSKALATGEQDAKTAATNFFGSEEYALKATDNETFVKELYSVFMNREADAEGLNFWVLCLTQYGMTREQAIAEFAGSEEFKAIAAGYGLE